MKTPIRLMTVRCSPPVSLIASLLLPTLVAAQLTPPLPKPSPSVVYVEQTERSTVPSAPAPPAPAAEPEDPEPPEASSVEVQIRRAQAEAKRAMKEVERQLGGMRVGFSGPDARRLSVIPHDSATEEALTQSRDDLAVMSTILRRAVQPERGRRGDLFLELKEWRVGGARDLEALQIDGYGAVFFLGVDFPLVAPASREPQPAQTKTPKDNTWEKTRRELTGGGNGEGEDNNEFETDEPPGSERRPFDPERVNQLEQRIKEAMRYATHLRNLDPEDWIIVQVNGAPPEGRPVIRYGMGLMGGADQVPRGMGPKGPGGGSSQMIFRVRKAVADQLELGKVSTEDFFREVTVSRRASRAF